MEIILEQEDLGFHLRGVVIGGKVKHKENDVEVKREREMEKKK